MADNQLNEKAIEKRLMSFNNSQESVQGMSLWIMHNRSQHQKIVDTWMKVLRKSDTKHKLTLFYLCNDVVQHAKKKKALYYLENFKDNLREAVHIIRELDSIKPNINRIFKIWEERRTYDGKFINELRKIMDSNSDASGGSSTNATPASSPVVSYKPSKKSQAKPSRSESKLSKSESKSLKSESSRERRKREKEEMKEEKNEEKKEQSPEPAEKNSSKSLGEFKTTRFIEEMSSLRSLEGDANLKAKQLAAMRIDATNMEAVKQLKDRSHGKEFCKQFEESCLKIEDYVAMLEKEISQRRLVLSMCDEGEAFYDEQYSEAKVVATAYKNFGARVTNMKKRVDDMKKIIPSTPSPVPSPSADAPSPGNTPPLQDMDDNDTVDMEVEEDSGPAKIQDSGPQIQQPGPGGAYTAMVKSIAQPISSVTDITMREEGDSLEQPSPPKEDSELNSSFSSITDTFQGSNILESRIASMLPNLAKGTSNIGSQAPVVIDLQESPEISEPIPEPREPIPDYVPPKPVRQEVPDDRSSTPVQDEPDEKSPSPPKSPPVSKPPVTKIKTNPIDFLSQLLTKTSNSSSSSNFLQSLSLLTNTVKNQYQKKQETEDVGSAEATSVAPAPVVEHSTGFAAVPPPEPMTQTSTWPAWKNIVTPPQPPLPPQAESPSPPVLPGVKSPDGMLRPPIPQHPPPLPPEPFPLQPPSPQNFPVLIPTPPPSSQSMPYGPPLPSLQPPRPTLPPPRPTLPPPRPTLQPFTPTATSPPAFPVNPVNSQSFPNQTSGGSTSPGAAVLPRARSGFNPLFPFGPVLPRDGPPPPGAPPPPQPVDTASRPPHFQSQNSWEQPSNMPPEIVPPNSQSRIQVGYVGPPTDVSGLPPWRQDSPTISQQSVGGYGNTIHTLSSSRRLSWDHKRDSKFNQRDSNWNREVPSTNVGGGYAHPWDQPQNYEDDEDDGDVVETLPPKPPLPAPKSILRNRSSSLREVTLVDESGGNNLGHNEIAAPAPPPAPDMRPTGMLRKPPTGGGGQHQGENHGGDVQSEFIAKLKQKSGSSSDMSLPPPTGGRQLTSVSMEEEGPSVANIDQSDIFSDEPVSTIGVISSNGRTASVKSDDMELDSDEHDSVVEAKSETSWDNTDEQLWQEERQGLLVTREYPPEGAIEVPGEPESYNRPGPPRPYGGYDALQPRGFSAHRSPGFQDQFREPPPVRAFHPQRPRLPYYRY